MFSTYDAAYLIGALSPEERNQYEQHLLSCPDCRASLGRITGVPGLLARVPVDSLHAFDRPEAPPESLLPGLLRQVDRRRRRWQAVAGGLAAAACLAVALVLGLGPRPAAAPLAGVSTSSVVSAAAGPVTASAQLTQHVWGTHISLHCMYKENSTYPVGAYRLVVIDHSGTVEQVATWTVVPGKEAVVDGSTSLTSEQIATLQVRTETNAVVLALTP